MKYLKIIAIVVVVAIVGFVIDTVKDAGEFKRLDSHFNGHCASVAGIFGAEDITINPQTGLAFISSDNRRKLFRGEPTQGAIYAYDLKSNTPEPINLTRDFDQEFHPHGISLFMGENGVASLFVVNHRRIGHYVEIFDYRDRTLVHRESISDKLMTSPNDVLAIGTRSFYVTNDHGNASRLGRTVEEYLRLENAYVLYYDGKKCKIVAQDISYANGINASHDGRTIYVASTIGGKINVYARDISSGRLEYKNAIVLGTGIDNIEIDGAGNLWVAAHPKLLTFTRHAKDPAQPSPSQALKIAFDQSGNHNIEEVYLNDGNELSGSSVAAVFEQKLIIGSVFDDHFLICAMK